MNNNELFNKFKREVAIYNFDQEYNNSSKARIYPLKKDVKEWRKYFMKKRILQTFATLIVIFTCGITVYAGIKGSSNFKDMGLLKVSENFEEKKIEVNKTIENEYVKIEITDVARDSAYLIVEYDIFPKEKAIEKMGKIEYDSTLGYMLGISARSWINEKTPEREEASIEKISEEKYRCSYVINVMNFDDETLHLRLWFNNFYIGSYTHKKGVKINKMFEIDVKSNNQTNENTIHQEQELDKNTAVVLEKIENSSFETYIRLKRISKNTTWKKYEDNIEYYRFKVASDENDTISSICYDLGKKVYKNNKLIEDYSELKDNDIVKVEESYAIVMGAQTNLGKLKIMQTKSTFFSDRTNEEKEAYYKAKWYPLKEGDKKYTATNNNGGVFEINKITIDDEKINFYFNKKGIFGETSYIDLRVNDGTMNYICPIKDEVKGLTSDENKIVFNRDGSYSAGLGIKDGMLDDLSKVEFTMLFGDVDEIIGEPIIVNVPEQSNEKIKIDNVKIIDTLAEKYEYNKTWIEVDSYNGEILNYFRNQRLPVLVKNNHYIKANNLKQFKEEIENVLKEQNIDYKIVELKSGEYVNLR